MFLIYFFFFFKSGNSIFKEFAAYSKWIRFAAKSTYFFSINFFLQTICKFLTFRFNVHCLKVPKRLRRKLRAKVFFRIKYVQFHNDFKKGLKWLFLYRNYFDRVGFRNRLLCALLHTFFEEKKSFLYLKKIQIYKKVLIKSKTKE